MILLRLYCYMWVSGMFPLFIHMVFYRDALRRADRSTLADIVVILMWPLAFQSKNGRIYLRTFLNGEGLSELMEASDSRPLREESENIAVEPTVEPASRSVKAET